MQVYANELGRRSIRSTGESTLDSILAAVRAETTGFARNMGIIQLSKRIKSVYGLQARRFENVMLLLMHGNNQYHILLFLFTLYVLSGPNAWKKQTKELKLFA